MLTRLVDTMPHYLHYNTLVWRGVCVGCDSALLLPVLSPLPVGVFPTGVASVQAWLIGYNFLLLVVSHTRLRVPHGFDVAPGCMVVVFSRFFFFFGLRWCTQLGSLWLLDGCMILSFAEFSRASSAGRSPGNSRPSYCFCWSFPGSLLLLCLLLRGFSCFLSLAVLTPVPSVLFAHLRFTLMGHANRFCSMLCLSGFWASGPHYLALVLPAFCDRSVSGRALCVVALWVRVPSVPSWYIVLRHRCLLPSCLATAPSTHVLTT